MSSGPWGSIHRGGTTSAPPSRELQDRLPIGWRARLDHIETISRTLFEERGHAFYGDETSLTPASELFGVEDARRTVAWVDELLSLFEELLRSLPE